MQFRDYKVMNRKSKILLLTITVFSFITVLISNSSYADTGSVSRGILCDRRGSSTTCTYSVSTSEISSYPYYQAYVGRWDLILDGHGAFGGAGGKGGANGCLNSSGAMWSGACWLLIDSEGAGNVGDLNGVKFNGDRNIGGDYVAAFKVWVVEFYVNDATFTGSIIADGRRQSIDTLTSSNYNVQVGQSFTVNWSVRDDTATNIYPHKRSGSADISCGYSYGQQVSSIGSTNCSISGAGTARVLITAFGPSGMGPSFPENRWVDIDAVAPPPGGGNCPRLKCVSGDLCRLTDDDCDSGGNPFPNQCSVDADCAPPPPPGPTADLKCNL